jgi:hypothetical protein
MESVNFVLPLIKALWPEDKQDEYVKEVSGLIREEIVRIAGGEDKGVEMEFVGVLAWGWKA